MCRRRPLPRANTSSPRPGLPRASHQPPSSGEEEPRLCHPDRGFLAGIRPRPDRGGGDQGPLPHLKPPLPLRSPEPPRLLPPDLVLRPLPGHRKIGWRNRMGIFHRPGRGVPLRRSGLLSPSPHRHLLRENRPGIGPGQACSPARQTPGHPAVHQLRCRPGRPNPGLRPEGTAKPSPAQ